MNDSIFMDVFRYLEGLISAQISYVYRCLLLRQVCFVQHSFFHFEQQKPGTLSVLTVNSFSVLTVKAKV